VNEQRAHQVSCASAVGEEALGVGGVWLVLTTIFEFGFGRSVAKKPWRDLLADYNLAEGRLWPVVLTWIAIGPEITRSRTSR
jgi:hypothetical protein